MSFKSLNVDIGATCKVSRSPAYDYISQHTVYYLSITASGTKVVTWCTFIYLMNNVAIDTLNYELFLAIHAYDESGDNIANCT